MIARIALAIVVLSGYGACIILDHGFEATELLDANALDAPESGDASVDGPPSDGPPVNDGAPGRVLVSPNPVDITEGGTAMISVSLDSPPAGSTNVTCSSTGAGVTVPGTALVFTAANYNVPQQLTLTALQDPNVVDEQLEIQCAAIDFALGVAMVVVTDDDTLAIETSQGALMVTEGMTASFGIRLSHAPAANVTVNVVSGDNGVATVAPALLTFTTTNYNTYQLVTVNGVTDADTTDDTTTLMLTSVATANVTVPVTVIDVD